MIKEANAQFEADEISAEDLFMVTVMHDQIIESLELAKVEMVIALNKLVKEQSPSLTAQNCSVFLYFSFGKNKATLGIVAHPLSMKIEIRLDNKKR